MKTYRVEMKHGQPVRTIEASDFRVHEDAGWMIFYRNPPQGGMVEYWRARLEHVVSMETAT